MNRLAAETSPYLLQHAENPVDWYPWGEEALARARGEDRPILLSIGYAACHWCHVMEHESFEDEATAAQMNEHFVCIKVDREERPDLDAIYMDAVVALTGHGGWPMTVFLTPEGEPFFGGTYYPPAPRHGLPSFRQVLDAVAAAYRERREDIAAERAAARRGGALLERGRAVERAADRLDPLRGCARRCAARSTRSTAASAARPSSRPPRRSSSSCGAASSTWSRRRSTRWRPAACTTSSAAASTATRSTRDWLVPHFEKMLYDNALLVPAYLHAWVVTGEERYRARRRGDAASTCSATSRLPEGGFASSQDADTDGVEGLTYTWTEDEGVPAELLRPFEHGRSIIRGDLSPELRARLLEERSRRPQPGRDDKAIAAWNGLALAALAEAGRRLPSNTVLQAATELGNFLLSELSAADGRLFRTWRNGQASIPGFLEDYADVAHGLYELHVATGELRWLEEANRLARLAVDLFADERHGGFFMTARDAEELVARKKDLDDNPVPSGNSMLAFVLLRLARIYGDDELERRAAGVLRLLHTNMSRIPSAFGWALCALDLYLVAAAGARDHRLAGRRDRPARAHAVRPERGRRIRPGRRSRCSRARHASTASRRSTSASGSPAGRR